ncbi:MAG: lamin tail domain-containing protein [Bacteroidota bacterium]
MMCQLLLCLLLDGRGSPAGGGTVLFLENFDTVSVPSLPSGWRSSRNRSPGQDDFTTAASAPHSGPNALLCTNATVAQHADSPPLDFTMSIPESLEFFLRRSSTFLSPLLLEISLDGGATFALRFADTIRPGTAGAYVRTSVPLPDTLGGQAGVRFRWRTVAVPDGSSGTFRLEDVRVTGQAVFDLALLPLLFHPPFPVTGDSVRVLLPVRNRGTAPACGFRIALFEDADGDSVPRAAELLADSVAAGPLAPADSCMVSLRAGAPSRGRHLLIGVVEHAPDLCPANNTVLAGLTVGIRPRSVVVNEIMYAPAGTEPEWVEIRSASSDTACLEGWSLSDEHPASRRVFGAPGAVLPPLGYMVITRDSAALRDAYPLLTGPVAQVTSLAAFNNTGDAAAIYDERGALMDSVRYEPSWGGNGSGASLERRDPGGSSTSPANWGNARWNTPGTANSISRRQRDLGVLELRPFPEHPAAGDSLCLAVTVANPGILPSDSALLGLFLDADADTLPSPAELLGNLALPPLSPCESLEVRFCPGRCGPGTRLYLARVWYPPDEDSTNNTAARSVTVGYGPASVRINELMYAPPAGHPEWVELVNVSPLPVNLEGWRIGNRSLPRHPVAGGPLLLEPESLLVVTKDTALLGNMYPGTGFRAAESPGLPTYCWNNGGDAVVLEDNLGGMQDSLRYHPLWGGAAGVSLERVNPRGAAQDSANWSSSLDPRGGTPGGPNSVVQLAWDLSIRAGEETVRVAPGGNACFRFLIRNEGLQAVSGMEASLFRRTAADSAGAPDELIAARTLPLTLLPRETAEAELTWRVPPPGLHACLGRVAHPSDPRERNNEACVRALVACPPGAIVVNEIMYDPLPGRAEYVELLNPGPLEVDLSGWILADRPGLSGSRSEFPFGAAPSPLRPGEMAVLSGDSSLVFQFPHLAGMDRRLLRFGRGGSLGLNNDGDAVVLLDPAGRAVDSVPYEPGWHNPGLADCSGRSLERLHPRLPSLRKSSWSTTALTAGGTPGLPNSLALSLPLSSAVLACSPNPFSPDGDGFEDAVIFRYATAATVSMVRLRIFDTRGRLIRTLLNNEPSGSRGDAVWDGRDDGSQRARIGMYVALLEAVEEGGVVEAAKTVVVLASRLR